MIDNVLSKCQNCDCYIYFDPVTRTNTCLKPCKNCKTQETCQSTVKIIVRGKRSECNESSGTENQSDNNNMKKLCSKLCRKKDSRDDSGSGESSEKNIIEDTKNAKETANQTSKVATNNTKVQMPDRKLSEDAIYEYFKQNNCRKSPHGVGGCNTNTIIIPRDKCGDCNPCLEGIIRNEIKTNTKILEDIFNELYKQRRDIHDLKETLEVVVRALREQFLMTSFGNNKNGLHDPFDDLRKNSLERKSNTLSIANVKPTNDKSSTNALDNKENQKEEPPEKQKRKFPWCF